MTPARGAVDSEPRQGRARTHATGTNIAGDLNADGVPEPVGCLSEVGEASRRVDLPKKIRDNGRCRCSSRGPPSGPRAARLDPRKCLILRLTPPRVKATI